MHVVYIFLDEAREGFFARRVVEKAPPVYRSRVAAMASPAARARTMAGLWLLEQGLARLGYEAERVHRLGFSPAGRPEIADGPFFSISHSERLVACALEPKHPIGLDVEARREGVSARLRQAIASTGDFFDAWCAREATVKASGRVGLARIRAVEIDDMIATLDIRSWHLAPLTLAPGYSAWVASAESFGPGALSCRDYGDCLKGCS